MNIIGIIPARMASTRLPGKPLADIHGIPMVGHVYFRSKSCKLLNEIYIATCDEEIRHYAESVKAPCVMTADTHERCSDRTAEAMLHIEKQTGKKIDIVVMIQGDEPMIHANMIESAIKPMLDSPHLNIVNLMADIVDQDDFECPNEVKVVVNSQQQALYFSREPIPSRKKFQSKVPMLKQLGIILFKRDYLLQFNSLESTPLEKIESVDMLRVLENGDIVQMVHTPYQTVSVDTEDDLSLVRRLMVCEKTAS